MQKYTIRQVRGLLDNGTISALELTRYYLHRIEKLNPKLKAYITVTKEQAEKDAAYAQELIDLGNQKLLTGIPIAIRDNISTQGVLTTCGSKILKGYTPVFDATVVACLKAQGVVVLGKTNVNEFGMGEESSFGTSSNPYTFNATTNGAGVAVSADMALCAIFADMGEGALQANSFCGVTGMIPTYGKVSRYGLISSSSSLCTIGAIANNANDCAIVIDAISGKDKLDMTTLSHIEDKVKASANVAKGRTIGVVADSLQKASLEISKIAENAINTYKQLGYSIKQIALENLKYALSAYYIISSAESSSNLARYDGIRFGYRSKDGDTFEDNLKYTRSQGFGQEVKKRLLLGVFCLSSDNYQEYYQKAELVRAKIKCELEALFQTCDYLLCPMGLDHDLAVLPHVAGLPSISTVCGYSTSGAPVGVQLIAPSFAESNLAACVSDFENVFSKYKKEVVV